MKPHQQDETKENQPKPENEPPGKVVTPEDEAIEIEQQNLRRAYLEQQKRMRCPGCGETDETF